MHSSITFRTWPGLTTPQPIAPGLSGHAWTVLPAIAGAFSARRGLGRAFATTLDDERMGAVRITGFLDEPRVPADHLVVIVHGFGADANSANCIAMASAARRAGMASLRLNLRGADLSGEDIYHGGLTDDIRAALASRECRHYKHVFVAGFSVGGNIALRAALNCIDRRIRAVASVCAPLDLAAGADAFDRPVSRLYRNHVFSNLNRVYAATAAKRRLANPVEVVRKARSVRERDELVMVPRFGFRSADDYYFRIQAAGELYRMDTPALIISAENDPVVPFATLRRALRDASAAVTSIVTPAGGHISFPGNLQFWGRTLPGLENQIAHWLLRNR